MCEFCGMWIISIKLLTIILGKTRRIATWCKELTYWKRPWCWERLRAGGEGDDRGWDCWMTSLTQWTWVWVTPGVGDGQGGLACCSSWGRKELDTTEWLNWTESTETTFVEITPKICMSPNQSLISQPLLDFCALWDTVHHCLLYLFMTAACGILVPQPGIKPVPSAVSAWSPNHWTTREVPITASL